MGPIAGADAASFRLLKDGYAADAALAYFWGKPFAVRDVASFEVLDYGFTRDHVRAYNRTTEIADSDGASFAAVDLEHAKDATHVWFTYLDDDPKTGRMRAAARSIIGVDVTSFEGKTNGYAVDAKHVYYQGHAISSSTAGFEYLSLSYAKSASEVFYDGKKIRGANAATFTMMQPASDQADASDSEGKYLNGRRV